MHYIAVPGLKFRHQEQRLSRNYYILKQSEILKGVSEYYHVTIQEMKSKSRKANYVRARQAAYYFLKLYTRLTLKEIGTLLGNRDHTSVIHGLQTIKHLVEVYPDIGRELSEIDNKL
jgi:chromosomal replication initiator protein